MAEKKRKHSGRSHLSKEAWHRQHATAFARKVARFSTWPDGENGSIVIVEHIDPRCYPIVRPASWPEQYKREAEEKRRPKRNDKPAGPSDDTTRA